MSKYANLNIHDLEKNLSEIPESVDITQLKLKLDAIQQTVNELDHKNEILNELNKKYRLQNDEVQFEMDNHRKVSIMSNFSKQITERDKKIEQLQKRLDSYNSREEVISNNSNTSIATTQYSKEEDVSLITSNLEEKSNSDSDDENIEFELKVIDGQRYFISDEEPNGVYECTSDEDVGDQVGYFCSDKIIFT
jgi:predicted RNase H-like nuclease (RuvC/YqgF family)